MTSNFQEKSSFIWSIADLLRGPYKRNEYQKVILPFTVLKRFDSVLAYSKKEVLKIVEQYENELSLEDMRIPLKNVLVDEEGNKLDFYNTSKFDFDTLLKNPEHIEENILYYIDRFSRNLKDILNNFNIKNEIERLSKSNLLYLLMKKFSESAVDLSPKAVSNHEMGMIFEELIRKFSETNNDEAGEHFTPRDIIKLMTSLIFINESVINEPNKIISIYAPACGTRGMLTISK